MTKAGYVIQGLLVLFLSAPVQAANPVTETSFGIISDSLTGGRDDWKQTYISLSHKKSKKEVYYGTIRYLDRLQEAESELEAGIYYPVTKNGVLFSEVTASSKHVILPSWRWTVEWQQALGKSLIIHGGYKHTEYELGELESLIVAADYYYGNWRLSYQAIQSKLEQDDPRTVNRFDIAYYYGNVPSSIALRYVDGEESEIIDQTLVILTTEVRSLQLIGKHELSNSLMWLYRIGKTEQGNLYDRTSIELGIMFRK